MNAFAHLKILYEIPLALSIDLVHLWVKSRIFCPSSPPKKRFFPPPAPAAAGILAFPGQKIGVSEPFLLPGLEVVAGAENGFDLGGGAEIL